MNKIILALLISLTSHAAYVIKLDFNIPRGKINLKVPKLEFSPGMMSITQSSCIGLCFGGGRRHTRGFDITKRDAYFFLLGDPDNMSFYYFQAMCSAQGNLIGFFDNRHEITVLEGDYSISALMITGAALREDFRHSFMGQFIPDFRMNDYVCTEEFRQSLSEYRLDSLASSRLGHFTQRVRKDKVRVRWDPEKWEREVDKEAWDLMADMRRMIERRQEESEAMRQILIEQGLLPDQNN